MERTKNKANSHEITLYFYPNTRAIRAIWLLEELEIDYQLRLVDLVNDQQNSENYLMINPLAKVPAMAFDSQVITETLAICLFLSDKFSQAGLAPSIEDKNRLDYYRWVAFASTSLEPAIIEKIRDKKAEEQNLASIKMNALFSPLEQVLAVLEKQLAENSYFVANKFSTADLLIAALLIWAKKLQLTKPYPNIESWITKITSRKAYQLALSKQEN